MPGQILNIASTILCSHGGTALLATSNSKFMADNVSALLESDMHPVVGCPFTIGPKYSPCIRIEWAGGATQTKVNGVGVLVSSSVGKCINAEGATQGVALIVNTQIKVMAK